MLYVERDKNGKITALRNQETSGTSGERLPILNAEVLAFLNSADSEGNFLAQAIALTDESIIRIIEDLIDLLVKKNIILFTELPDQAQEKLRARKEVREMISPASLMVDDEDIL